MSDLIAVAYDSRETAERVAGAGAAGGALWGGLIGLIFLAPLLVLVQKVTPDEVLPRISQYGGRVIQSSLSTEAEQKLQEALSATPASV